MSPQRSVLGLGTPAVLLAALSLSVGWGIRGNFGHEYGAMIPGALAAMAVCLLSGRADWWRRAPHFAFFGAVGWSFGGSMSYGHVLGYAHSGVLSSVLYGFACLFVIGFLWGAVGGAATAMPACLSRERLTEFYAPLLVVFAAWGVQDVVVERVFAVPSDLRQESPLYWYDTDWLAALLAVVAVLLPAVVRRRLCGASRLILCMAIGWWLGFLVLVNVLHVRMTPPRGDNWAGMLGMTAAMLAFFIRGGFAPVARAALVSAFVGGFGFSTATCIKIVAMKSGLHTNWHSVMEQTYGFINGLGIAAAMGSLALRQPRVVDEPPIRRWTDAFAVFFVLIGITYINLSKNPEEWVKAPAVADAWYGLHPKAWFDLGYLLLAAAAAVLLARHVRRPLPLVPASWLGKGQWLYLVFLWWVVVGNFERTLPTFQPQRLITEGVIYVNAILCTLLLLLGSREHAVAPASIPGVPLGHDRTSAGSLGRLTMVGLIATPIAVVAQTAVVRMVWGDTPAQPGPIHIRFGPRATATDQRPPPHKPHP